MLVFLQNDIFLLEAKTNIFHEERMQVLQRLIGVKDPSLVAYASFTEESSHFSYHPIPVILCLNNRIMENEC